MIHIYKPLWPVILVKASRYLLAVSATTSSGMPTPSLPFRPELVSQSRRYCYELSASIRDVQQRNVISNTYLVVRRLALADLVLVGGPEARAVGSEDFVDEHDLAGLVEAELELGVGDDDAALFGVLPGLREKCQSKFWRIQHGNENEILPSRKSTSSPPRPSSPHSPRQSPPPCRARCSRRARPAPP